MSSAINSVKTRHTDEENGQMNNLYCLVKEILGTEKEVQVSAKVILNVLCQKHDVHMSQQNELQTFRMVNLSLTNTWFFVP